MWFSFFARGRGDTSIEVGCFALDTREKDSPVQDAEARFRVRVTTYVKSDHGSVLNDGPHEIGFSSTLRHFLIPDAAPGVISRELSLIDTPFADQFATVINHWMEEISSAASLAAQEARCMGTGFGVDARIRVFCRRELLADVVDVDGVLVLSAEGVLRPGIRRLEVVRYRGDGRFREEGCAICFDDFVPGMKVTRMRCSHTFHGQCLARWFERRLLCPLCRRPVY